MSRAVMASQPDVEQAIAVMRHEFSDNEWLLSEHWPLNEPHVRLMIADVSARFPTAADVRVLDVGCFNGYMSVIFRQLGYNVTGTDVYESEQRDALFQKLGIEFVQSNMNEMPPFAHLSAESFHVVIIAQVIEHILNYPLGLIRSLADLLLPGGLMILTTPNPVTVMGAVRLLKGRSLLWGTNDFIDEPKIGDGEIISKGDIHYREYTSGELCHMITGAGLRVEKSLYLGLGNSQSQSALKRVVKNSALTRKLMSKRLFGSNHYFLACKPQS